MSRLSFNVPPSATNTCLRSLYDMYLYDDRSLNRRPPYQRNLCWMPEQKSNLIDTVMTGCPMPIFLLYMFNDVNECIDGQNRLTAIKEYMEQGADPFPWKIITSDDEDKPVKVEYVFYKKNDEIDAYITTKSKKARKTPIKEYRYMTEQEVRRFDSYEVVLQKIQVNLSLDQRKEIFTRWQSGRPITQCDKFKNEDFPFCKLILEHGLEKSCADKVSELLKSGKDNWVWDVYRMLLVFMNTENIISFSALNTIATRVNISKPSGQYDITNDTYKECVDKLLRFIDANPFLKELPNKMKKLSFIISFAHIWFKKNPDERKIMETKEFLDSIVEKCEDMKFNTLNNGPHSTELLDTYPKIKAECDELVSEKIQLPYKKKIKISEALKTSVWNKYVGELIGSKECLCCGISKMSSRDFHCSHVIAEAKGGSTTLDNLRPTCAKCNLSCSTKNLREFARDNYGRAI
jgi:hypothetical protein